MESEIRAIVEPLAARAELQWHSNPSQVSWVNVVPFRRNACGFSIAWSSHEIVLSIGEHARIELGPDRKSLVQLGRIVGSIYAGRIARIGKGKGARYRIVLPEREESAEEGVTVYGGLNLNLRLGRGDESECEPY